MTPLVLSGVFAAVVVLTVTALVWQRALVMNLPFLVILNGLTLPLGGVTLHADQVAACLLVVPLAASVLVGERRLRMDATAWWLTAILALNVAVSVAHSPSPGYSLRQCANLASVWVIYALLLNFLESRDDRETFLRRVLRAAVIASVIGIGAFVLSVAGLPVGGAEVSKTAAERLTQAYGAYGTMVEPNILGSFTAAHLLLGVVLLVAVQSPPSRALRRQLIAVVACTSIALVLSFTRAAWLAVVVALLGVATLGARRVRLRLTIRRVAMPLGVLAALIVALLLIPGDTGNFFRTKVLNVVNLGSSTVVLRLVTYGLALQQSLQHIVVGWGTFTFAPLVAEGADFQQFENWHNLWIGNYLLLALHDTGLVGLACWVGLLTTIVKRAVRAIRLLAPVDPLAANRTLGLLAGVSALLIAFLATSGFSLGYSWMLIGLLGAHSRLADDEPAVAPAEDRSAELTVPVGGP